MEVSSVVNPASNDIGLGFRIYPPFQLSQARAAVNAFRAALLPLQPDGIKLNAAAPSV
jgi:hypothetical protein